jgi:hypothetical protein
MFDVQGSRNQQAWDALLLARELPARTRDL